MYGRIFLVILIIFIYLHWDKFWDPWLGLVEVSAKSGRKYRVRKDRSQEAVELIDEMWTRLRTLVKQLATQQDQTDEDKQFAKYVQRIAARLDKVNVRETEKSSPYTSYSINKGEELVFCTRSKKEADKFHTVNDLMYVGIHEIAHIGSPEVGHTPLFHDINKYLLKKAASMNMYVLEDYASSPKEYCGISLTTNILL